MAVPAVFAMEFQINASHPNSQSIRYMKLVLFFSIDMQQVTS